jgi:hypothetical protein
MPTFGQSHQSRAFGLSLERKAHTSGEYRCWWDNPDVLDMVPDLQRVRGVKRPILFHVNDEGERV